MQINSKTQENLQKFILKISEEKDYKSLLNHIFEYHLIRSADNISFERFEEHIHQVFSVDPNILWDYFATDGYIMASNENNFSLFKDELEVINNLKKKYGIIVLELKNKNENPFMLMGTSVNVKNNGSLHNLKFNRMDGEELFVNVDANALLATCLILNQSLTQAIKVGIFSLNGRLIQEYTSSIENLTKIFHQLIKERKDV